MKIFSTIRAFFYKLRFAGNNYLCALMEMKIKKYSEIRLRIGLDEHNTPTEIIWDADDDGKNKHACKGLLLSLFDEEKRDTVKIDLWTQTMQVNEMDRFFFQTLRGLADTYFRATKNQELATQMQQFVQHFGEQTQILPKS